ncbi:MAG TPA: CBS domain-containing protein [Chthonomonadaceae bacterium]|nr:CBS domain-containing protein [Chthonomonadaceae bacterium]
MRALELMRSHIVKTTPDATLLEAVDMMDLYQVNGLPVVDETGRLVGMLMEGDVFRALFADAVAAPIARPEELRVGDFMTSPALSVPETMEVRAVAELMRTRHLKRLPVLAEDGQIVGMLSRVEVCQALLEGNL